MADDNQVDPFLLPSSFHDRMNKSKIYKVLVVVVVVDVGSQNNNSRNEQCLLSMDSPAVSRRRLVP